MKYKNTLMDLLNAIGKRTDWLNLRTCEWAFRDGEFVICDGKKITGDAPISLSYYYYDHLVDEFRHDETMAGFATKDYKRFCEMNKLAWKLYEESGICFMPGEACIDIMVDGQEYFFGEVYIGNEEIFMLVDCAEHECG